MGYFYLSYYLLGLNPSFRLLTEIYRHCVALGIACRPHYIHHGPWFRLCPPKDTTSDGNILAIWSAVPPRLCDRLRDQCNSANDTNLCLLNTPLYSTPSGSIIASMVLLFVKMALINANLKQILCLKWLSWVSQTGLFICDRDLAYCWWHRLSLSIHSKRWQLF